MTEQDLPEKSPLSRRNFLKLLGAAGVGLAFKPFIPWGKFMPNPPTMSLNADTKIVLADGTTANVNTFPVNHFEVITYPPTGDSVLDQEAFRKWQLIRLPKDLGGEEINVSAFRAYSMVCLHSGVYGNM